MPLFGSGFEAQKKLKPNLKMAVQRMAMVINKKTNMVKRHKGGIVQLIQTGKIDKANIKVEHVIREDRTIEAYEIISLMCELLVERLNLIAADKICPADLVSSIHTVIWAGPRLEAPELKVVTQQFGCKYGKDFVRRARQNADGMVNEKIMTRLNVQPPSKEDRVRYMKELCGLAGVEYTDDMVTGSTLVGVFDDDNRVGSKAAEVPELPTFASYQGGKGPGGPGGAGGAGAGGYPGPGGGFTAPPNAMGPGNPSYPRGVPAAAPRGYPAAPGGYPAAPGGYAGPAGGAGAPRGFPAVPGGPGGLGAGAYRTGDPMTGAHTPWTHTGGAPAGAMPGPGPAPASVPSFPMPPTGGMPTGAMPTGEYGRAAFSAAMSFPTAGATAGPAAGNGAGAGIGAPGRTPPAGLDPTVTPTYPPPGAKPGPGGAGGLGGVGAGGAGGVAPSRAAAPSAVPDFDELSARFAALRDA